MKKRIFGSLLLMEGCFLLFAIGVSLFYREGDLDAFLITASLCFLIGAVCKWMGTKGVNQRMSRTDNFLVVALSWIMFSVLGMIPFLMVQKLDISSAFFETMSGFTTTGATCISDIESMTHALKFWRSITQWMGGLGIVVFTIALIPSYEMKNNSIFSAEVPGVEVDKLRPKIASTARRLLLIYLMLSALCALFYWAGPMNLFDAVCHSMTTIATGGFSTHTASIAHFHSTYLEYVAPTFMILSGVNFSLYYYASIRRPRLLLRNEELHFYLGAIAVMVIFFVMLFYFGPVPPEGVAALPVGLEERIRSAYFHVATNMTSTGYSSQKFDYVAWGGAFWMPTVLIMSIGSCAGSTAGGIKIIRILISIKTALNEFILQLHPRAVLSVRVNNQIIPNQLVRRTLSFLLIYAVLVVIGMICFTLMGLDADTGLGSSISMLSNVGPGTGTTGPASNFSHIPAFGKWLMSFYMLVGRLEIYSVLFLFIPSYWKERR
ncbi:MAG: TrkH family potassium uptake protein [Bacteroidaceae bacterium]|nr:TrkH family potassium uptake protein [Bacteroidaceae bacterium]